MQENLEQDLQLDDELSYNADSVIPPSDIVAFTEQRSCADIYRMYEKKQLDISPDFQRGDVWGSKAQTLFIDSLIKQLPIPSMCISLDATTQKRLVIDGRQRITSIIKFLSPDKSWKLTETTDVDERISGKTVADIFENTPELYDRLENVTIPVTVLRCDYSKQNHMQYLFQIFHRLNSGGLKLYNQEIRNCIYQGSFNTLLKKLAVGESWCRFADTNKEKVEKARLGNEERILRFFAFSANYENYKGRMTSFLNDYMSSYRNASEAQIVQFNELFDKTLSIANKLEQKPNSKNISDAVLVGISKNVDVLKEKSESYLSEKYKKLMEHSAFSSEERKEGLARTEKVKDRIQVAIQIFGND